MGKINIKANFSSEEEKINIQTIGIKTKNKIIYKENSITVTVLIYNNKIEMYRVCNDYKINLIFEENKKTASTYTVYGMPKTFELETITEFIKITDTSVDLKYNLEGNKFSYSLEIGG